MRFTLGLPVDRVEQPEDFVTAAAIGEMATTAERVGFAAVNVTDHPFPSVEWINNGGHHALDPLVALSFAAAATSRIQLHTNIYVLAYRNPFLTAKGVATLDALSGGRVILGVGAGYLEPEFAGLGVPFAERGKLLDESLDAVRAAWRGEPVSATGRSWQAAGNIVLPRPASRPHPPIWVGGNSPAALRRVARSAQGWIPFPAGRRMAQAVRTAPLSSAADLQVQIARLHDMAAEAGRGGETLDVCCTPFTNTYQGRQYDLPALRDEVAVLADAGVTWLTIYLPSPDRAGFLREIDTFAETVLR